MKNWDNYRFVLALNRYGSVADAADALNVSTITVSRHIENLTQEVGRPLFDFRDGRWAATELGHKLSTIALSIESEDVRCNNIIAEQDDELRGTVRINSVSFINDFFLAQGADVLLKKHPRLVPILEASNKTKSLSKGEAEISVRLLEPQEARLIRTPLCKFPMGLFKVDGGAQSEWVGLPESMDYLDEMKLAHAYFGKPPRLRVDSYPAIAKAAKITGLVSVLPTCISPHFAGISRIAEHEFSVTRDAWVVYHEMNRGNKNCAAVVDWVKAVLGNPRGCACKKCTLSVKKQK